MFSVEYDTICAVNSEERLVLFLEFDRTVIATDLFEEEAYVAAGRSTQRHTRLAHAVLMALITMFINQLEYAEYAVKQHLTLDDALTSVDVCARTHHVFFRGGAPSCPKPCRTQNAPTSQMDSR